jgi:hypothetical protein
MSRWSCTIATGAGTVPVLVERLRTTEAKRRELLTQIDRTRSTSSAPSWREMERRIRGGLTDWRSLLTGDVAKARQGFRQLLSTPIRFTPCVERGFRAIRFEGRLGLEAVFGGLVIWRPQRDSNPCFGLERATS